MDKLALLTDVCMHGFWFHDLQYFVWLNDIVMKYMEYFLIKKANINSKTECNTDLEMNQSRFEVMYSSRLKFVQFICH